MSNKSVEISQIEASLHIVYTAFCEKCGKDKDHYDQEPNSFSQSLYKEGWRIIETANEPYLACPSCAEKILK